MPSHHNSANSSKTLRIKITDLARGGSGFGRDENGRVVFIPKTAPGDVVQAIIINEKKNYAEGKYIKIIEASKIRQTPLCKHFLNCGGCTWQHIPYELQWETKKNGVFAALKKAGIPPPEDTQTIRAEKIWNYRNRIQLRGTGKNIGFYAKSTRELIPINECLIANEKINQILNSVRSKGENLLSYKVELEVLPSGELKETWDAPHASSGFRQINDEQNNNLCSWVYEKLSSELITYDLFGGNGNFSLCVAKKMCEVHCVDLTSPPNKIMGNVFFHKSPVLDWLLKMVNKSTPIQNKEKKAAILDPPRRGLEKDGSEIAKALEHLGVKEIILVGCDPDSIGRDILKFLTRGWLFESCIILDFFPQTPHVETGALLKLKT